MRSKPFRSLGSCFLWICFVTLLSQLVPASGAMAAETDAKRSLYESILANKELMGILDQIEKDPENQALMDSFLIRLPMSPLDFFTTAMEASFREYMVPKHIGDMQERWLKFHPEYSSEVAEVVANILYLNPSLAPLAPVVGTNRDEAFTYSPAPIAYQGEIQLSVNKNNTLQMVDAANSWNACGANANGTQDILSSTDGGSTWRFTCSPDVGAFGLTCAQPHFGSDPAVAWDNSNNAYMNYMLLCCNNASCTAPRSAIVVAKSTDAGLTWSGLGMPINDFGNTFFDDKQFYAIDNTPSSPFFNRHYSCWDRNNNERIAYSSNGGVSWTNVDTASGAKTVDIGCDLAISDTGTVYLVWDGLACGASCTGDDSYFLRSTNGGVSWSTPVVTIVSNKNLIGFSTQTAPPAEDARGINPFGSVDIDINPASACYHNLYFAYTDLPATGTSGTPANIYVKRSTSDGATWSAAVQVNDDAVGVSSTTTQFHPWLQVDQTDGSVIVGWHDTRHYSANSNRRMEAHVSRSINCGVSWEANIQVSQNSSEFNNNSIPYTDENTTDNPLRNPNQYGEYMGVDAHNRVAYLAWTDSRQFYPSFTSNTQKENVAFANVTFCSVPTGFGAPTVTPGCNGTSVKVDLSWSAPASWGTNATGGTYSVERATIIGGPYTSLVSGLSGTTYTDNTAAASTTYFYRIVAKNNCPGTALTPMSLTSAPTSGTTGVCSGLPPVGDGWPGHGAGNPATFNKSGTNITANWDAVTCNSTNAIIVYGTIGNYSAYVGSVDCAAGTSGTKTFTPPAGDLWFNILWKNGSTTGHPGYSSAGERTWSSVGLCSTLADNFADNVCN